LARTPPAAAGAARSPRTCRRAWTRGRSISSVEDAQQPKGAPEMAFEVPDLPYPYDALEPHIDEATMRVHHRATHRNDTTALHLVLRSPLNSVNLTSELGCNFFELVLGIILTSLLN